MRDNIHFTEHFIRRPVLAIVLCLALLFAGLLSLFELPLRLYPKLENNQIVIITEYPGAGSDVIQGYITQPVASAVTGIEGLDFVHTSSVQGQSTVTVVLKLGADGGQAMIEIMSKVSKIKYKLPKTAFDPQISKTGSGAFPLFYLGVTSESLPLEAVQDVLEREVQPKINTLPGVSRATVFGPGSYAMRVDLIPWKMSARNISASQVEQALQANDFIAAPGQSKGQYVLSGIRLQTGLQNVEQFKMLTVSSSEQEIVRLGEIADIKLGPQTSDVFLTQNGKSAVFISVDHSPSANPLQLAKDLRRAMPQIQRMLPPGVKISVCFDDTDFIRASIKEIFCTLGETSLIVFMVIILFLASLRSVFIPSLALPLSCFGVCSLMLLLGFSLNILTMLAMVLAIGLVVDDAILVTENTTRHIEAGMQPFEAAILASKEVSGAIIAMTITLVAVFMPLALAGGLTGALFREFALTLAGSVVASALVALTLSPVLASRFLKPADHKQGFIRVVDKIMGGIRNFYGWILSGFMKYRPCALLIGGTLLLACFALYGQTPKELAPKEDQSLFMVEGTAPQYANIDYLNLFSKKLDDIAHSIPELEDYFIMNGVEGPNTSFAIYNLKPWGQRQRSQQEIMASVQPQTQGIAGLQTYAFGMPSLPGGYGLPLQVVLTTDKDNKLLCQTQEELVGKAMQSGLFEYVSGSLKFNNPVLHLEVDRSKSALLGVDMADIAATYQTFLSGTYVNRFVHQGRSYKVIPQMPYKYLAQSELLRGEVQTRSGQMVPLSSIVSVHSEIGANALTQFDQLNSATISGVLSPGVTLGQGLDYFKEQIDKLPADFGINYKGQSRQYIQEGNRLLYVFGAAVLIIYLILALQFNNFRDPLIILFSIPGALCGALIPLYMGMATINIFTQVGLLTLAGLIAKQAIMLVLMANQIQEEQGISPAEAAYQGALIRLRPFLMTTAAMAMGVIPLLVASGAGAHSRFDIGLVLFCGLLFGSLVTLIVVPVMYSYWGRDFRVQG